MILTRARFCDDFRPAVPNAAEFAAERIITDSDFLNLVLGRNAAARESIDHKSSVAARATAGARNLLQILRQFVFVIRQGFDEILTQNGRLKARVGIDADLVA